MAPTKRLKILFITKWYMNRRDPQIGVFIRKHASAAAIHHNVRLLCVLSDRQPHLIEYETNEESGVKAMIVYFRKSDLPFVFGKAVNFFRYLLAVRYGLKKIRSEFGRHDITHAYIMLRPALVAWFLKVSRGIPFVISEQWSGYATGRFGEKGRVTRALYRWFFRKAAAVTAVSEFLKSKMLASGLRNTFRITPNNIEPIPEGTRVLPRSGNSMVLTVADLVDDIKNISGTIRAVTNLVKSGKQIELHIVGHGPDEGKLKELALNLDPEQKSVFFHGVKSNREVFQYLYDCDFLVMNSRYETFSLICIEAMCCGKPVIATRCGGPVEFMNQENGILIDPDANLQLENAILRMASGEIRFEPEKLRTYALQNFGAGRTGNIFDELYHEAEKD